jgi:hypothetical protein
MTWLAETLGNGLRPSNSRGEHPIVVGIIYHAGEAGTVFQTRLRMVPRGDGLTARRITMKHVAAGALGC